MADLGRFFSLLRQVEKGQKRTVFETRDGSHWNSWATSLEYTCTHPINRLAQGSPGRARALFIDDEGQGRSGECGQTEPTRRSEGTMRSLPQRSLQLTPAVVCSQAGAGRERCLTPDPLS